MNSIKNGSKGKYPRFANSAMPSYKQLSDKEISYAKGERQSGKTPYF